MRKAAAEAIQYWHWGAFRWAVVYPRTQGGGNSTFPPRFLVLGPRPPPVEVELVGRQFTEQSLRPTVVHGDVVQGQCLVIEGVLGPELARLILEDVELHNRSLRNVASR